MHFWEFPSFASPLSHGGPLKGLFWDPYSSDCSSSVDHSFVSELVTRARQEVLLPAGAVTQASENIPLAYMSSQVQGQHLSQSGGISLGTDEPGLSFTSPRWFNSG